MRQWGDHGNSHVMKQPKCLIPVIVITSILTAVLCGYSWTRWPQHIASDYLNAVRHDHFEDANQAMLPGQYWSAESGNVTLVANDRKYSFENMRRGAWDELFSDVSLAQDTRTPLDALCGRVRYTTLRGALVIQISASKVCIEVDDHKFNQEDVRYFIAWMEQWERQRETELLEMDRRQEKEWRERMSRLDEENNRWRKKPIELSGEVNEWKEGGVAR
jgi:hypothetical protein